MDWQKLCTYIGSVSSGILGILVITHNLGDGASVTIGTAVSAVLAAVAAVFAANTQNNNR